MHEVLGSDFQYRRPSWWKLYSIARKVALQLVLGINL